MITHKLKRLAFLQDLFIAPDWGEICELIDEHVKLPEKGRAFISTRHRRPCNALQERGGHDCLACVDESQESLELALLKAAH